MNQALIINALLIIAGLYFGIRNLRLLSNEDALRNYMTTSPKARAWVQKYGVEESIQIARRTTVPGSSLAQSGQRIRPGRKPQPLQ